MEAAADSRGNELQDDDVPGPATPTSFREQCYLDRERLEKKRSRKSGLGRWTGGGGTKDGGEDGARVAMDSMVISPRTPASGDRQEGAWWSSAQHAGGVGRILWTNCGRRDYTHEGARERLAHEEAWGRRGPPQKCVAVEM